MHQPERIDPGPRLRVMTVTWAAPVSLHEDFDTAVPSGVPSLDDSRQF